MPIRYETNDARRRVVVRMQGPFALADSLAVIERQRGDNASACGVLYDLRGMTGDPTVADLRESMSQIAETHRLRGPGRRYYAAVEPLDSASKRATAVSLSSSTWRLAHAWAPLSLHFLVTFAAS